MLMSDLLLIFESDSEVHFEKVSKISESIILAFLDSTLNIEISITRTLRRLHSNSDLKVFLKQNVFNKKC